MAPRTIDFERFTNPSPQRADKAVLKELEERGQRNNVIALHVQEQLHALMGGTSYWYLPKATRAKLRQMQSVAFDGYYLPQEERVEILAEINKRPNVHQKSVANVFQKGVEPFIEAQEKHWKHTGYQDDMLRMHQEIDAADSLATRLGGRILVFGSARKGAGTPEYDAAQWLTQMTTEHFAQSNGSTEQVISGAGPGIMEAANKGALFGSWNVLKRMSEEMKDTSNGERHEIVMSMLHHRQQMTSIGVRVQLPFEAGWNDHLHTNITIKSFVPRKMAMISTAVGRGISHTKNTKIDWHGRHPAVFVFTGGFGTLDEMWDVACLEQCRKMPEMPLFVIGKPMRDIIEKGIEVMEQEGTISAADRRYFKFCEDEVDALAQYVEHYGLPVSDELRKQMLTRIPAIGTDSDKKVDGTISRVKEPKLQDPDSLFDDIVAAEFPQK